MQIQVKKPFVVGLLLATFYIALLALEVTATKQYYDDNDVFIYNLKLYVKGEEFFVKGIAYEPTPLGYLKMNSDGQGGGGFCSNMINYLGNVQSACFPKDYINGFINSVSGYPAPNGSWFEPLWERDLPIIAALGVNTIRIYHMSPFTQLLFQENPTLFGPPLYTNPDQGAVHTQFMDAADRYGFKVILPIVSDETILESMDQQQLDAMIEATVDELGNHPALLMWCVGNNLNLYQNTKLRQTVNYAMNKVRSYMLQKWNRVVPVTNAEADLPEAYVPLIQELQLDVYTANVYRGIYLSQLWNPPPNSNFPGWATLSKEYNLPLLLGEFGAFHQDAEDQSMPDWVNIQIQAIYEANAYGCIGGVFKEYSDQSQLAPSTGMNDMGVVEFVPATDGDEDSTDPGVFIPDQVQIKTGIYQALQSGAPGSSFMKYNFINTIYNTTGAVQSKVNPSTIPYQPIRTASSMAAAASAYVPPGSSSGSAGSVGKKPTGGHLVNTGSTAAKYLAIMVIVILAVVLKFVSH
jgi:hypothetical protein